MPQTFDWADIDIVLLDMDGTLIDLHYDNTLWNAALPERYAQQNDITLSAARDHLFAQMRKFRSTIEFYCLDYWAEFTDLDILDLHAELAPLIRYRPGSESFLRALQTLQVRSVLATNAHPDSVAVKDSVLDICRHFDRIATAHERREVKESQAYWVSLQRAEDFDPQRALFVDDNETVIESARRFGIGHLFYVTQPDSHRPARTPAGEWNTVNRLDELLPA
ncbi:MAG: HAD-IA family hydrolase [Pseudomonadota bacterium]